MKIHKQLLHGKGYIDGITIINTKGEILFTAKFNRKLQNNRENPEVVGKNFFDVYDNLTVENSTLFQCMKTGYPISVDNQPVCFRDQEPHYISTLSIPIKRGQTIIGAIDLAVDEKQEDEEIIPLELTSSELSTLSVGEGKNDVAHFRLEDILARSDSMMKLKEYAKIIANCDLPALIYGETGTGKEVFAQAIHNESDRRNDPFVAQNCAAIPETLLESILFGTAEGSFTGAKNNPGLFDLAKGGTLFLDELNGMSIALQSKLLRVLQDGVYRPVGSVESRKADLKILAAMGENPLEAMEAGKLRKDIYYRLNAMSLHLPPLRERREDISLFIEMYIQKYNEVFNKNVMYISRQMQDWFEAYRWPGNIRELEHLIIYAMTQVPQHSSVLKLEHVEGCLDHLPSNEILENRSLNDAVAHFEKEQIRKTLRLTNYNVSEAARILDLPRQTLQNKIAKYQLAEKR